MNVDEIVPTKVSSLAFDLRNPRLAEYDLTDGATETELIGVLWEAMDVRELVLSIAASGFFRHEPLIVAREDGKNVVIEGNRRLAAVKLLRDPGLAKELAVSVPTLAPAEAAALETLPTVQGTRESAWRYLGFKHVNGPAKWSSYAKSRYVAEVHRKYGVGLDDIAGQIGDTHKTVRRLYRSLMVIEQAERMNLFRRSDRARSHFSFSHLYTGLDYPGISGFLDLSPDSDEKRDPVPREREEELRDLCLWLYGSKKEETPPVVQSQNPHLRQLDAVVASKEAISALRAGESLAVAYEISRSSTTVFEESLYGAQRLLQKARGLLSDGYDGSGELLRTAESVATIADDLVDDMKRKRKFRKARRRAIRRARRAAVDE